MKLFKYLFLLKVKVQAILKSSYIIAVKGRYFKVKKINRKTILFSSYYRQFQPTLSLYCYQKNIHNLNQFKYSLQLRRIKRNIHKEQAHACSMQVGPSNMPTGEEAQRKQEAQDLKVRDKRGSTFFIGN